MKVIKEKIEQKIASSLSEGYKAIRDEDLALRKEVENADFDLRPFGLATEEFTVPDDFEDALPDEILADFEK